MISIISSVKYLFHKIICFELNLYFTDKLIPSHPDVKKLREVSISAYLRPQVEADSVGSLRIVVNTVTSGFEECGVLLQS